MFADINMPDINGLDFVRTLHNKPQIIFTTAFSEYAFEGLKSMLWIISLNLSAIMNSSRPPIKPEIILKSIVIISGKENAENK